MTLNPTTPCDVDCQPMTEPAAIGDPIDTVQCNSTFLGLCASRAEHVDTSHLLRVRTQCDLCGASTFIDTPIHAGASLRRDCTLCNHFLGWPVWYGRNLEG